MKLFRASPIVYNFEVSPHELDIIERTFKREHHRIKFMIDAEMDAPADLRITEWLIRYKKELVAILDLIKDNK